MQRLAVDNVMSKDGGEAVCVLAVTACFPFCWLHH